MGDDRAILFKGGEGSAWVKTKMLRHGGGAPSVAISGAGNDDREGTQRVLHRHGALVAGEDLWKPPVGLRRHAPWRRSRRGAVKSGSILD